MTVWDVRDVQSFGIVKCFLLMVDDVINIWSYDMNCRSWADERLSKFESHLPTVPFSLAGKLKLSYSVEVGPESIVTT